MASFILGGFILGKVGFGSKKKQKYSAAAALREPRETGDRPQYPLFTVLPIQGNRHNGTKRGVRVKLTPKLQNG